MDLSLYFDPVTVESLHVPDAELLTDRLLYNIILYNPEASLDIQEADIAIFGVPEVRNTYRNPSCSLAPDEIRRQFYQLYGWRKEVRIIDLGNLRLGNNVEDTYTAVSQVVEYLIENKVIPIILGGGNDIAFANYRVGRFLSPAIEWRVLADTRKPVWMIRIIATIRKNRAM